MSRSTFVPLLLTASLLCACDRAPAETADKAPAAKQGGDAAAKDPAPAAADAAKPGDAPAAEAKQPEPKPNTFKPPTRAEAAEAKQSLQAHLDAGRKAVKAKDYATGITELEQAIAINPLHAKSLGELGWAYFNAGKLDEAQDRLERGLKYADNDNTRGAILYNLGRVAEAKGDKPHAIELYTRSLAVRPNDIVSARLTSLGGTPPTPEAPIVAANLTHSQCEFVNEGAPAGHLCWGQLTKLGVDINDPNQDDVHYGCEYGRTVIDAEGGAVSAGGEVSVYDVVLEDGKVKATVFSYLDWEMNDETFVLSIVIDNVLYSYPLVSVAHPGVSYADESLGGLSLRTQDVVPGGRPELVIQWSINGHDMDPGIQDEPWEEELWDSTQVGVVSLDGSAPKWLAALTTLNSSSWGPTEPWFDDEPGGDEPVEREQPELERQSTVKAAEFSFAAGKLTVTAKGEASAPVGSFAVGEYPLRCPGEF